MRLRVLWIILLSGLFCLHVCAQSEKKDKSASYKKTKGKDAATPTSPPTPTAASTPAQAASADSSKDVRDLKARVDSLEKEVKPLHEAVGWAAVLLTIAIIVFFLSLILLWWAFRRVGGLATAANVTDATQPLQQSLQGMGAAIAEVHALTTELAELRTTQLPQISNALRATVDQGNNAVQNSLTTVRTDMQNSLTTARTDLQTTLNTLRSDVSLARADIVTTLQSLRTDVTAARTPAPLQGETGSGSKT